MSDLARSPDKGAVPRSAAMSDVMRSVDKGLCINVCIGQISTLGQCQISTLGQYHVSIHPFSDMFGESEKL